MTAEFHADSETALSYLRIGRHRVMYWVDDAGFHGQIVNGPRVRVVAPTLEEAYQCLRELFGDSCAEGEMPGGEAA